MADTKYLTNAETTTLTSEFRIPDLSAKFKMSLVQFRSNERSKMLRELDEDFKLLRVNLKIRFFCVLIINFHLDKLFNTLIIIAGFIFMSRSMARSPNFRI